jgi:hypothetical protein
VSLGIIELLTRIGEDNVRVQNVMESLTRASLRRASKRVKVTEICFATDAITPTEMMRDDCPTVGLVLWLPRVLVDKARADHQPTPTPPAVPS